ncbi:hypothetical protein CsSME_00027241 [Camellia sinensis var. sinensis]
MENIQHKYVEVRGLKLHVAEIETGPAVVFLHGFSEIWYSWRHQMIALSTAGFRAIAPDYRGYGLSEMPPEPEKTTFRDLIDDLLAILDSFGIPKVSNSSNLQWLVGLVLVLILVLVRSSQNLQLNKFLD